MRTPDLLDYPPGAYADFCEWTSMMDPCPSLPAPPLLNGATLLADLHATQPAAWSRLQELLNGVPDDGKSLAELAQNRGLPLPDLLYLLHQAAGSLHRYLPTLATTERARLTRRYPAPGGLEQEAFQQLWESFAPAQRLTLETRPLFARGEDPFAAIQQALSGLEPEGALLLLVPFEPLPLYPVLARAGFGVAAVMDETGWRVCVARRLAVATSAEAASSSPAPATLDVRGLPPPEPLMRVLEAVTFLKPGGGLTVIHDRIPALLYPRLAERGLDVTTEEREDGEVRLAIHRPPRIESPMEGETP